MNDDIDLKKLQNVANWLRIQDANKGADAVDKAITQLRTYKALTNEISNGALRHWELVDQLRAKHTSDIAPFKAPFSPCLEGTQVTLTFNEREDALAAYIAICRFQNE